MGDYFFTINTAGGREAVLSDDPGRPGAAWLDDYFDYSKNFLSIYEAGKEVSTNWHRLFPGGLQRYPVLSCFEHQVLSFWMQVLRDRALVENLIERERPVQIKLAGRPVDLARIGACRFDPGLFEHTLQIAAADLGVRTVNPTVPVMVQRTQRLGAVRAVYASLADRLHGARVGRELKVGGCVLVSRQAADKAGGEFLKALRQRSQVAIAETDAVSGALTLYEISAKHLSPVRRFREFSDLWRLFDRTPQEAWQGRFVCGGHDYAPIVRAAVGEMLARHSWMEIFRQQLLEEFLERRRPSALLVLYDHGLCEAQLVEVCRRRGIRTVTLQHGLANRMAPGYLPITSDLFACWGESERETLIAQGADPRKLVVTGFPGFDGLWDRPAKGEPAKPYRALVATQGVQASVGWYFAMTPTPRLIDRIIEDCSQQKDVVFTIRLHPNESISDDLKARARAAGITVTQDIPLNAQLAVHDVVITQFSTVGAEAMLAGLPLVSLNWVGDDEAIPYAESGAAVRSREPRDLVRAVTEAAEGHGARRKAVEIFLRQHLSGPGAGERLTGILLGSRF